MCMDAIFSVMCNAYDDPTLGNRLAVLSLLRQHIQIFNIREDGTLLHLMTIGEHFGHTVLATLVSLVVVNGIRITKSHEVS